MPERNGLRLSVVVPVHNGAEFLARCLQSLRQSEFRDYECIVVDDASSDSSARVAAGHGATLVALDRRLGPAGARNRGAERARGEILLFLDADVCVHPDTLARVDAHFREHRAVDAVFGSYDDRPADPGFVSQFKNLFHHYVHQRSRSEAWSFWAGCGAIRRRVFLQAGGFDPSYTRPCIEDIELGLRLTSRGCRIDLNPRIQVTHLKRWTLWSLVRTDVMDRGVPWMLLMLRSRSMPSDLNLTKTDRLGVALVGAMLVLAAAGVATALGFLPGAAGGPGAGLGALTLVALALTLFALHYDVYRFFARKRGLAFAAAAIPLHWLYHAYCGLSVVLGFGAYLWTASIAPGADPTPGEQ